MGALTEKALVVAEPVVPAVCWGFAEFDEVEATCEQAKAELAAVLVAGPEKHRYAAFLVPTFQAVVLVEISVHAVLEVGSSLVHANWVRSMEADGNETVAVVLALQVVFVAAAVEQRLGWVS